MLFYNFLAKGALCSWSFSMFGEISARLSGFSRPAELFCGYLQVSAITFLHLNNLCG
jgi:hypothetical protein